ncbi:hypothetical protein [Xanthomonas bonasiae]|nr:hypothetical protein [Xanthomonas surreyensis]MBD7923940.1 hypothetical protein [Xanthomonas surreyensis]
MRADHAVAHIRARRADQTRTLMDMLLAKKRAGDRKQRLETKGGLAWLEV